MYHKLVGLTHHLDGGGRKLTLICIVTYLIVVLLDLIRCLMEFSTTASIDTASINNNH